MALKQCRRREWLHEAFFRQTSLRSSFEIKLEVPTLFFQGRWMTCDVDDNAVAIARNRIRAVLQADRHTQKEETTT